MIQNEALNAQGARPNYLDAQNGSETEEQRARRYAGMVNTIPYPREPDAKSKPNPVRALAQKFTRWLTG